MAFNSSGPGGTANLASEVAVNLVFVVGYSFVIAVHFVPECLGYFSDVVFDDHHPNPPLYFCKWAIGNSAPIHTSLPLVLQWHRGLPILGVVVLSLWGV